MQPTMAATAAAKTTTDSAKKNPSDEIKRIHFRERRQKQKNIRIMRLSAERNSHSCDVFSPTGYLCTPRLVLFGKCRHESGTAHPAKIGTLNLFSLMRKYFSTNGFFFSVGSYVRLAADDCVWNGACGNYGYSINGETGIERVFKCHVCEWQRLFVGGLGEGRAQRRTMFNAMPVFLPFDFFYSYTKHCCKLLKQCSLQSWFHTFFCFFFVAFR